MYPCQDPIVNYRILKHHPYPIDFSTKKDQQEPHVSRKVLNSEGGLMLPTELWAEIFLYCLPGCPPKDGPIPWYNRDRDVNSLTAPLLLCQICRGWREVAVSLPQLWQRLTVYVANGNACPAPDLAERWLFRSGSLPLDLSLHQQNESNLNAAAAGTILNLFINHTMRWMNIDLQLAGPRLAAYPEAGKLVAPVLQQFRLRTSYRVYEKDERYIFGVFQDVPRLINLQVSRVPELDLLGNSTVEVPWHQLDALSLEYVPSIGTSLHILSKCESVRECTLKVDTLFGPLLDEPLVHPYLHSLSINISNVHFTGFFSRITLPALKNLSIHVRGPLEQYSWPQSCFEEFLRRSSCKLTRLELRDSGMRADQFISTVQQPYLQALQEFVVDDRRDWTWDPFVTDAGLYLMNCSLCMNASAALAVLDEYSTESESDGGTTNPLADQACFLPNLEGLIVRGNCLKTADGTIADMVESRFYFREHGVAQLRRVELDLPSGHLADLQRLKAMQAEGLTVELDFI